MNCDSFLKAFHGAPVWTNEELNFFKIAFEKVGIKCKKGDTPKLKTKGKIYRD